MTHQRAIAFSLLALDVAVAILVFNVVTHFRGLPVDGLLIRPLAAPIGLLAFALYLIDGYRARTDMLSVDYTSHHTIALTGAMLATLLLTYGLITTPYELQSSRFVIVLSFVALIPVTLAYRRLFYLRVVASREERHLVFLGDRESCDDFAAECAKMGARQRVIYSTSNLNSTAPFAAGALTSGGPSAPLQSFDSVLDDLQTGRVSAEAIVLRENARELPPEISRRLVELYFAGVPTYTLELFHQIYWRKIPLYPLNQTWLFQEGFQIAREPVFERLKRAADLLLATVGLLIFAPVIAGAAVAIWMEDRGRIFFAQTRVGKNHRPFRIFKLRTMRGEPLPGERYTRPGDARITRVGRFLRHTRLDELPQLWNVLRGDMSLIGPRAEWDQLVEQYEREIPSYHFRHLVKPGITGWAQVNYPYGASTEDTIRKLEYDLYYIRHFSFLLDASIVLKTIHIMLFGKGR